MDLILVLRNLYCNSDTEVPVGTTEYFTGTRVPVGTIEQIPYTEVLVYIPLDLYLSYGYGSTRRYYRTCTYLLIQEYP